MRRLVLLSPSLIGCAILMIAGGAVFAKTNASYGNSSAAAPVSDSRPIVINGKSGTVIDGLKITSTQGDCVRIVNSKNITIQNSEIGPCGGNAVSITGGAGISIFDSYIHPETQSPGCCDHNDGVYAIETSDLRIQGNVIAYGESNIEVQGGTSVTVIGNFLLNPRAPFPRGQNFQCWSHGPKGTGPRCRNVTVSNNYAVSSTDTEKYLYPDNGEDSINFGQSDGVVADNNFIVGGHSNSGCGLIADKGTNNAQFRNNRLLDTGQCGIGISDGSNHLVENNKVLNRTPVPGAGNQGIYVWQSYKDKGNCSSVRVSNNISIALKPDGSKTGFWKGKGCDPVTLENNVWGPDAGKALAQVERHFAPPPIPPQPKSCAVRSPYTTDTSVPSCPDSGK
jgi:Right handed beta helix region